MHAILLATLLATLAAASLAAPPPSSTEPVSGSPLEVPRSMTPLKQAIDARWRGPEGATIVLLDHEGRILDETGPLATGAFRLCEALPAIDSLDRAAWLQPVSGGEPLGSAWVIVPLRDRPPIRVAPAVRPDGKTPYTKVVGWGDQPLDPDAGPAPEEWKGFTPPPLGGFRLFPEMDAVLETDRGAIVVALRPDEAPNTAWNFRELVAEGLYDGTIFHRIVPLDREGRPFVIQGGDPTGEGEGGPGYSIPLEPSRLRHDFGVISMARDDDPDSAGSQFFIGLSRDGTARLDGQYAAFGEVVDGAEVITAIAAVPIADAGRGRPEAPPVVTRAFLRSAPPRRPGEGRPDHRVLPLSPLPPSAPPEPDTAVDPGR